MDKRGARFLRVTLHSEDQEGRAPSAPPTTSLVATSRVPRRSMSVVGLFSGIGGLELGLEQAGHVTALQCELLPSARAVLDHASRPTASPEAGASRVITDVTSDEFRRALPAHI